MYAGERAVELLEDQDITGTDIISTINEPLMTRKDAETSDVTMRGVGIIEAPRGSLIHDYQTDGAGIIQKANLIVATGQNNLSMDIGVRETAKAMIHGDEISEGLKNRLEMVIRAYDPCLSCATHMLNGESPLVVDLHDSNGKLFKREII